MQTPRRLLTLRNLIKTPSSGHQCWSIKSVDLSFEMPILSAQIDQKCKDAAKHMTYSNCPIKMLLPL